MRKNVKRPDAATTRDSSGTSRLGPASAAKLASDMKRTFERLTEGRDLLAAAAKTRNATKKTYGQVTKERERVAGVEKKRSALTKSADQVAQGRAMLARSMRLRPVAAKRPEAVVKKQPVRAAWRVKPKPVRLKKSK